ncbi:MAG: hypothetical protein AVDCRST_MAG03-1456 [uncultured Rubrobacteraceae bacterium]|uniref:Uncharacterized protein n=1 Tax=uncultured Rubrobacteraceae bacterium TaxID=349277 RepID=A0A6J4P562_9ACTN|nr:MAG: hypothetical protein AVDCRST_MAG03-1456 [uncultured Rubrobacteraceae bacterium]
MLGREVLRERYAARRSAGRGRIGRHDQHGLEQGLEEVLEWARVWRRRSELGPERGWREAGGRHVVTRRGFTRVVPRRAVVVGVPVLHGRVVEGGLLRRGVHPAEPSHGRDGLGDHHEQRQDARGGRTQPSGTEERADVEGPSYQPRTMISHWSNFAEPRLRNCLKKRVR